jgi:hypothetical protein
MSRTDEGRRQMKLGPRCSFTIRHILSFVRLLRPAVALSADERTLMPVTAHRLVVGWDDALIACGPGTVAGMDSPPAVERMVQRWKARGIKGVYWRVHRSLNCWSHRG